MKKVQNSKLHLTTFLLITIYFLLSTPIYAQENQTVTSEGVAAIIEGNTAIARDNALKDAQRKAVEQAVGAMVASDTVVQNFQLVSDRIYSQSQGYIQNYKISSEGKTEGNLYKMTIQAVVSTTGLKNDLSALGLLLQSKGMPRVLFMIAEQNVGQKQYAYWWGGKEGSIAQGDMNIVEHTLTEKFLEKGFNIVDYKVQSKNINLSPAISEIDITDNTAKAVGKELNAEVVILGKASAKLQGSILGSGILSSQASISAKVIKVDTGGVIASTSASGAAVHSDEITAGNKALEKVGTEVAEKLIEQIVKKWGQEASGSTLVQMVVSGIGNYADFVKFKNAVQDKVRGVQAINHRSLSGGIAVVDIDIKGSANSFADEISLIDFKGFTVNVSNVSSNRVELTLSPKK